METSHLFRDSNQTTGFYMRGVDLKLLKHVFMILYYEMPAYEIPVISLHRLLINR